MSPAQILRFPASSMRSTFLTIQDDEGTLLSLSSTPFACSRWSATQFCEEVLFCFQILYRFSGTIGSRITGLEKRVPPS